MARNANAAPRKAPNGTWSFNVDIGTGPNGRRLRAHRRGFPTKRAAQEELDRLRHSVATAAYVAPKNQTVGEFLTEEWLAAVRHELARSTWESYDRNIRNHVIPILGGLRLQQVDGSVLNRFYATLLEVGRKRGMQSPGLKPRTVRYIHTIVHAAFDDAVRWRRLVVNPASQATPPSAALAKPPEMRVWTGPQVRRFLELCDGDRYRWPWLFLATTGCRRGEALGLRWSDVDLDRRLASIRQELIPLTKPAGVGREGMIVQRTKAGPANSSPRLAAHLGDPRAHRWRRRQGGI
jgi:integrase